MKKILIVGRGDTSSFQNREVECISEEDVKAKFGYDSDLHIAYKDLYRAGVTKVTMINIQLSSDYVLVIEEASRNNYSFIVPLFDFYEKYTPQSSYDSKYIIEAYSEMLEDSNAIIVGTSSHAKEFEDIESFISLNKKLAKEFKKNKQFSVDGENISYVTNNLKEYKYANIALAASLSLCDFANYPSCDNGSVVFDLVSSDFKGQSISFFAFDKHLGSSIENLYNCKKTISPRQYIPISCICKTIDDALALEEFKGRLFTAYTKIAIESKVDKVLNAFVGSILKSFRIISIDGIKSSGDMTMSIQINVAISPINSIDEIKIERRL